MLFFFFYHDEDYHFCLLCYSFWFSLGHDLSHSHIQINIQHGALYKVVEYTLYVRISTCQTHNLLSVNPCLCGKKVTIEFKLIGNAWGFLFDKVQLNCFLGTLTRLNYLWWKLTSYINLHVGGTELSPGKTDTFTVYPNQCPWSKCLNGASSATKWRT